MNRLTSCFIAATLLAAALAGATAFAHHSQTQFDTKQTLTVQGVLTEVRWTYPHSWFYVDGNSDKDSTPQSWALEGPGPRGLEGAGWTKETAKIGERLLVTGSPRKDGKPQLLLLSVTLPDGKRFAFRPEQP